MEEASERVIARVSLNVGHAVTEEEAVYIAKWLRAQSRFVQKHATELSPRYRARCIVCARGE